jgi:tripartite-type tricarboxylate transporter receptor subunit TctC
VKRAKIVMPGRTLALGVISLLLSALFSGGTAAAAFPEKEITLICPWPAGGSSDLITRSISQGMAKHLPKATIVVNRDGANGVIATTETRTAKADGYTIIQGTTGLFTIQPLTQKNLGYKMEDFDFLIGLTNEPILLVVHADSPYKTVEDLIQGAKKENRIIRFSNSGLIGLPSMAGSYFFQKAGVKSQPIPFKGGAPALTAMLGKHVDAHVNHPGDCMPHIKSGTLRPLVISAPQRFFSLPDVPTMKERGYDIDIGVRKFIFAPKGIPADIEKTLVGSLQKASEEASFKKAMSDAYLMLEPMTGGQVRQHLLDTLPIVKKLVDEMPKK